MRLCFLADAGSANTQVWVNYFAESLGHDVHVASLSRARCLSPAVTLHQLGETRDTRSMRSKLGFLAQTGRIRELVREISPDIVVGYRVASYGYVGARTGFHPLAVVAQGQRIVYPAHSLAKMRSVRIALKTADIINSWAPHMTDRLVKLGADPEKILTCPRGIDLGKFARPSGSAPAEFTVVSTRGLNKHYGADIVLRASSLASERLGNVRTAIAGGGEAESALKELAKDLSATTDVWFAGEIPNDELPSLLGRSDVYVSAVRTDGVSASLLEAMACGCFPIVTDNAANRLWVEDGVNGFLVAAPDPHAFAAAMVRAMDDPTLRLRARDENLRIVRERADMSVNMRTISDAYQELVTSG
ncbi:glycosyltransferase [bacterium]|nr:glycosyltransferase [bacterium]